MPPTPHKILKLEIAEYAISCIFLRWEVGGGGVGSVEPKHLMNLQKMSFLGA